MDIEKLLSIKDEAGQVNELYSSGYEETRLNSGKAAKVEFITTMRVLSDYLTRKPLRILDLGAGAGAYTVPLAQMGHEVDAVELAEKNVELLSEKTADMKNVRVFHGSATDLSAFESDYYDIVLVFGPLYHLHDAAGRNSCISQSRRVLKNDGVILFAFISNDAVPLTEMCSRDFFNPATEITYDHDTFHVTDFPFVFFTLDAAREMIRSNGVEILREIASDGVSELLEDVINAMSEISYQEYLKYHFYCCEKPEMLGRSNHLLFVGRKM